MSGADMQDGNMRTTGMDGAARDGGSLRLMRLGGRTLVFGLAWQSLSLVSEADGAAAVREAGERQEADALALMEGQVAFARLCGEEKGLRDLVLGRGLSAAAALDLPDLPRPSGAGWPRAESLRPSAARDAAQAETQGTERPDAQAEAALVLLRLVDVEGRGFWWLFARGGRENVPGWCDAVLEDGDEARGRLALLAALVAGPGPTPAAPLVLSDPDIAQSWLADALGLSGTPSPRRLLHLRACRVRPLARYRSRRTETLRATALLLLAGIGLWTASSLALDYLDGMGLTPAARARAQALEERRREIAAHPERIWTEDWRASASPADILATCTAGMRDLPLVVRGWTFEGLVCEAPTRMTRDSRLSLRADYHGTRTSSYVDLPEGFTLHPTAADRACLTLRLPLREGAPRFADGVRGPEGAPRGTAADPSPSRQDPARRRQPDAAGGWRDLPEEGPLRAAFLEHARRTDQGLTFKPGKVQTHAEPGIGSLPCPWTQGAWTLSRIHPAALASDSLARLVALPGVTLLSVQRAKDGTFSLGGAFRTRTQDRPGGRRRRAASR